MQKKPLKPNPKFLALWRSLTPAQRKTFALYAKSVPASLRQHAEGRRGINPDLAIRIERAATRMRLKPLLRTELNETCRKCEYAVFFNRAKLD